MSTVPRFRKLAKPPAKLRSDLQGSREITRTTSAVPQLTSRIGPISRRPDSPYQQTQPARSWQAASNASATDTSTSGEACTICEERPPSRSLLRKDTTMASVLLTARRTQCAPRPKIKELPGNFSQET